MASKLSVNTIETLLGTGTLYLNANVEIDNAGGGSAGTLLVDGVTTLSGAVTHSSTTAFGGDLDLNTNDILDGGGLACASVTASGEIAAATFSGTDQATVAKLKVGSAATGGGTADDLGVRGSALIENNSGDSAGLTVEEGNIVLAAADTGSVTSVNQLQIDDSNGFIRFGSGGSTYGSAEFLAFGAASALKAFATIAVDLGGTCSYDLKGGGFTTISNTGSTITLGHSALNATRCILSQTTITGAVTLEEFYVSDHSATTSTVFTLRNGDDNETGKLFVAILDS